MESNRRILNSVKCIKILGETNSVSVKFNYENTDIEIHPRDFFFGNQFVLSLSPNESKNVINLLAKARNILGTRQMIHVGETANFVVDSDGYQSLVLMYEKNNAVLKLGFNEAEVTAVIDLLVKAKSLSCMQK